MEKFEPFDLKIGKLSGNRWDRQNHSRLLQQFLDEQGLPRYSIEPRIVIVFDKSKTSDMPFLVLNKKIIINALLKIAYNPYKYSHWLDKYGCWGSLFIIPEGQYEKGKDYYEHPLGIGIRETDRAQFSRQVLMEVCHQGGGRIKLNPNYKEHGKDGELMIDLERLKNNGKIQPKQLELF